MTDDSPIIIADPTATLSLAPDIPYFSSGFPSFDNFLDDRSIPHSLRRKARFNIDNIPDRQRKLSNVAIEFQAMDDILELLGLLPTREDGLRAFSHRRSITIIHADAVWTWELVVEKLGWNKTNFRNLAPAFRWGGHASRTKMWDPALDGNGECLLQFFKHVASQALTFR